MHASNLVQVAESVDVVHSAPDADASDLVYDDAIARKEDKDMHLTLHKQIQWPAWVKVKRIPF